MYIERLCVLMYIRDAGSPICGMLCNSLWMEFNACEEQPAANAKYVEGVEWEENFREVHKEVMLGENFGLKAMWQTGRGLPITQLVDVGAQTRRSIDYRTFCRIYGKDKGSWLSVFRFHTYDVEREMKLINHIKSSYNPVSIHNCRHLRGSTT